MICFFLRQQYQNFKKIERTNMFQYFKKVKLEEIQTFKHPHFNLY